MGKYRIVIVPPKTHYLIDPIFLPCFHLASNNNLILCSIDIDLSDTNGKICFEHDAFNGRTKRQ